MHLDTLVLLSNHFFLIQEFILLLQLQGAVIVSALFELVLGFSGLIGLIMKYIGPLVIATTISLIGLSLFRITAENCSQQWGIAIL